ncbi:hypothetical protein L226DRAFT_569796 [Lentinus tigrinus ALCF2SS1-7]|uniref:Uncharacterized protein n=1 Tax=Lentinus tigrinus ALCF2SS1-6 TaxID=1328759 RepID=A0A5C2SSM3_9APHY|nr:hypothetical protein L227DRAFT_608020 [Lentinus tigrinus ALCF2SS1-6]RPD76556.1 hypothetical protein L226DRAFT_569796 [Lentinus tigrinus ALCF2SS1-7]
MEHSRLPIELCELVIDLVREPLPWWRRHELLQESTPRQFVKYTLVCFHWLPRARFLLYHTVAFESPVQVELFKRSITENPSLVDNVRELKLDPRSDIAYIPVVLLMRCLPYLRTLIWNFARQNAWAYPPRHHSLVARLPITDLAIRYPHAASNRTTWMETFRLIWSLDSLQRLHLFNWVPLDVTLSDMQQLNAIRPLRACANLKTVVLEGKDFFNFLPERVFGVSVTKLSLIFRMNPPISGIPHVAFLAQLRSLSLLKELYVWVEVSGKPGTDNSAIGGYIMPILQHLPPQDCLQTITIRLDGVGDHRRDLFLLELSTSKLDELLTRFTNLQSLCFRLPEWANSGDHYAQHWHTLLQSSLLKVPPKIISVVIDRDSRWGCWADDPDWDDPNWDWTKDHLVGELGDGAQHDENSSDEDYSDSDGSQEEHGSPHSHCDVVISSNRSGADFDVLVERQWRNLGLSKARERDLPWNDSSQWSMPPSVITPQGGHEAHTDSQIYQRFLFGS